MLYLFLRRVSGIPAKAYPDILQITNNQIKTL